MPSPKLSEQPSAHSPWEQPQSATASHANPFVGLLRQTSRQSLPPKFIIGVGRWVWHTMWQAMVSQIAPRDRQGAYVRPPSQFRHWIGQGPEPTYPAEAGRYCLYVGLSCPWAHRTLVVRALKGLAADIEVVTVVPSVTAGGWVFPTEHEGCRTLAELYQRSHPSYQGRSTVPVLWDQQTRTIVNNESADIIVMLNDQFNATAEHPDVNLYPDDLKATIDGWNDKIYHGVNNGVYRCGFAQSQAAYEQACQELFAMLDDIDGVLADQRYLCGNRLTLADIRLFTTLFRFDVAYYGLFKCNRRRIQDYQQLGEYLRDIYQLPGVAATCDQAAVKQDYYGNLFPLNPSEIIPLGPDLDNLREPHGRDRFV